MHGVQSCPLKHTTGTAPTHTHTHILTRTHLTAGGALKKTEAGPVVFSASTTPVYTLTTNPELEQFTPFPLKEGSMTTSAAFQALANGQSVPAVYARIQKVSSNNVTFFEILSHELGKIQVTLFGHIDPDSWEDLKVGDEVIFFNLCKNVWTKTALKFGPHSAYFKMTNADVCALSFSHSCTFIFICACVNCLCVCLHERMHKIHMQFQTFQKVDMPAPPPVTMPNELDGAEHKQGNYTSFLSFDDIKIVDPADTKPYLNCTLHSADLLAHIVTTHHHVRHSVIFL
jgi:hypothetical protein